MGIIFRDVSYIDVNNASFEIKDNKITGIVGNSKSFKEELFDLLTGRVLPINGKIMGDIYSIGFLCPSIYEQFFYDNIGEEFYFQLKIKKIKNIVKRANDSLKIVGLDEGYLKKNIKMLSYSEKKRVCFALALSCNPSILVLYEPFLGLSEDDKKNLIRIIRLMKIRYSRTIIIFSKDTDMIHKLCDEVILINNGIVERVGDKYSILSDYNLMRQCHLSIPKLINFSNIVLKKKKIDIGYRDELDDLIKDIYRFVR